MLLVSESVALYRGSAKTQDKKYLAQEQHELQPATRKNQDNGYHTFNIYHKKRHNCELPLRAFVLCRGCEKKKTLKIGTTQLGSKRYLNQRPEKIKAMAITRSISLARSVTIRWFTVQFAISANSGLTTHT
jgi:hypothetical protein